MSDGNVVVSHHYTERGFSETTLDVAFVLSHKDQYRDLYRVVMQGYGSALVEFHSEHTKQTLGKKPNKTLQHLVLEEVATLLRKGKFNVAEVVFEDTALLLTFHGPRNPVKLTLTVNGDGVPAQVTPNFS